MTTSESTQSAATPGALFQNRFQRARVAISQVVVGNSGIIDGVLMCLCAGGHVLLEGVPGVGKTLLVRTLAEAMSLTFSRVQFTPDLMPADITGTNLLIEDEAGHRSMQFQRGPLFANIVLADEINRATPKTQSAMLEAMQEHAVTVSGRRYVLDEPFFVLATQNPIEMEGTYPLPEAQLDRFLFKLIVPTPSQAELSAILDRTTGADTPTVEPVLSGDDILQMRRTVREVPIASHVRDYAVRIVLATHPESSLAPENVRRYVRYGASPRGAQALVLAGKIRALLAGRYNVAFEDIASIAPAALRHRIILNFEAEADGYGIETLLRELLTKLPPNA